MSDHSLPDEIISEILSPALKVSDEVFSDTSNVSPFAKYSESTSAYLLVCKSWLRVATPLLYNVVILRSKAQAKALSLALSGNKQLGQFVKKLRVEGGYGPPMHIILRSSPNISDLFISFDIYAGDNTVGLCKGLPLINPTRLILRHSENRENKIVTQLVDAAVKSISKWDRLCVFDCPYNGSGRSALLIPPLVKSKRLHTLIISQVGTLSWAYSTFKQCPLQVIRIKQPIWHWEQRYIPRADPVLMALLQFSEKSLLGKNNAQDSGSELPSITPSLNPSFIPLAEASEEVYDAIWSRILYFAMFVPELANDPTRSIPPRLALLSVSRTFNRLGVPHYYTYTVLENPSAMFNFASVLSKTPSIGPCVRSLVAAKRGDGFDGDWMLAILSQTSKLVRLGARKTLFSDSYALQLELPISWDAFEAMTKCSGSTLREFSVRIEPCPQATPAIFKDLTALRTLAWKCETVFVSENTPSDGLPSLEELRISLTSDSFLTALSLMKLESLQRVVLACDVVFPETFRVLEAHGCKLTELTLPYIELQALRAKVFEACPNLSSISVSLTTFDSSPPANYFRSPQAVPSLLKITLDQRYWSRDKDKIATWEQFFIEFNPECFPNLREIEVKCCAWPTSERDIAKSCWVRWAEILLKHNIALTDKTGKKWRPRLK
ncbi:hypothetical protein B0H19DRAFT_719198 [Mycena capillaripes]|nr:hypothetical protein B0H19DRAFT_719198 [Mycena capillaripes]